MTPGKKSLAVSLALAVCWIHSHAIAQQSVMDSSNFGKQYMIQMDGGVLNEAFHSVKALLTFSPPATGSLNEYFVSIVGYPKTNQRNTFFWDSEQSEMQAFGDQVTCKIKKSYVKLNEIHFFYLSPVLLNNRVFQTQRESERRKLALKTALPTKVFGKAGELHIRFYTTEVRGSVWIKGYDAIERSHVLYRATFFGRETEQELKSKWSVTK